MKYDIKIYGIEERKENILHNKEILKLSDEDIFILNKKDRTTPQDKMPYKLCKKVLMSPVPKGVTHRVILQDDNELCPNFKNYIDRIINNHPDCIVMLTALDFRNKNSYGDNLKSPYVKVGLFVSGNALIIPVKYIEECFNWLEKRYPNIDLGEPHEDSAFKIFADNNSISCITTVPSLAQHIGDVSTCCEYKTKMRTAYFSDWEKANWDNKTINNAYVNIEEFKEYIEKEKDHLKYTKI